MNLYIKRKYFTKTVALRPDGIKNTITKLYIDMLVYRVSLKVVTKPKGLIQALCQHNFKNYVSKYLISIRHSVFSIKIYITNKLRYEYFNEI